MDKFYFPYSSTIYIQVIGFYFSNHPISLFPKNFFTENQIIEYEDIINNLNINNAKVVGSILDIKERSNKDGRKYAFLTISNIKSQFELSIFSDTLREFRDLLKEGSVLVFTIDISRDNENIRMVVRKIEDLESLFNKKRFKLNLYLSGNNNLEIIDSLIMETKNPNNDLYIYFEKNQKLISLDFSKNYEISNYAYLDKLNEQKKINYSIEIT